MKVLIVEDEIAIRRLIVDQLLLNGLDPIVTPTKQAALAELAHTEFDVAILDTSLPDGSGLDLLEPLQCGEAPTHVIIVSSDGTEADRVRALELGADDYVVKPFYVRELAARVMAVRRRRRAEATELHFGSLTLDLAARRVMLRGTAITLSAKEFDLLAFLAVNPGRVFSRAELLRTVWRSAADLQHTSTVTEHMWRLRSKLENDPRQPTMLQTVRGVGYRFDPPPAG